ncbi:MAG: cytochrome c oxidase subunit 3 [Candidatus Sericytochromatia bacterium]|nr:cytochrome c oxidase subunit 3 [Candidatus Sericytochromatia bacterium]
MTDHSSHAPQSHAPGGVVDIAVLDPHVLQHEIASIFPSITGLGTGLMLFGIGCTWNDFSFGPAAIVLGLTILLSAMIGWWWELVRDNALDENSLLGTPDDARRGLRIGFGFFIGSEVMFFAAFFAYYFYARTLAPVWPPEGFAKLPWDIALVNTALLVVSGFFYMRGEHMLEHGRTRAALPWMGLALLLGFIFLGVQAKEWQHLLHEGFSVQSGPMGTAFYLLTGFHGFHVIIGAIFITVVTARIWLGHFSTKKHFAMTAAGWYWHFVDVVWIGLVLAVYLYDYVRDWAKPAKAAAANLDHVLASLLSSLA